jgi:transcriptional antiterminator RfaH
MTAYWYAMQSKTNKEDALYEHLQNQGIEVFYPRIRVKPVNPRAKKVKAYFPGYLFIYADLAHIGISTLQWMPFARGMVIFDQEPATVPESLIHALRKRLDALNTAGEEVEETLHKGEAVLIQDGPFAGYEAIFDVRLPGSARVRVLIKLLSERQVPLELNARQIQRERSNKNKPADR